VTTRKLDENGDMCFGHGLNDFLEGKEEIAQNVDTSLKIFKGEWFLNPDLGIPYLKDMRAAANELAHIFMSECKSTIENVPGVSQVIDVNASFSESRQINIDFTVLTKYNEILKVSA